MPSPRVRIYTLLYIAHHEALVIVLPCGRFELPDSVAADKTPLSASIYVFVSHPIALPGSDD
jgi:hypothetical protein